VQACAGQRLNSSPDLLVSGVCTDSRLAQAAELFVALRGERFDGHDFLNRAIENGVGAVLIERNRIPSPLPKCGVVAVADTRKALGALAAAYRKGFSLPMIAVGGSNGKTTTKELVASVLGRKFITLRSEASFNNDVGVPATLLRLDSNYQAAVLEAGTNHPGELAPLIEMIRPRYGIITNIGREHLEFFGDLAGVAREEGWLAELLPNEGMLLVNGDGEWTNALRARTRARVVRAGFNSGNEWRAVSVSVDKDGTSFQVRGPRSEFDGEYRLNLLGRHQAANALFAIALGAELGLTRAQVEAGLSDCQPAKMRLQSWELNGVRVLDDAYNANADSVLAALQTLQELPCKGRRVAVLGDMAELGAHSEAAHEEVGRRAAELGIGQLFAVGKMAAVMARGARSAGLNRVLEFSDVESAASAIKGFLKNGDLLLLKASRASRLERITDLLRAGGAAKKLNAVLY
jgi:UDP-N-acetylmuramoyl-tripeptide--D-alanyl-D-alanine ligase